MFSIEGNLFIEGYIHQSIEYTASHIGNAVPAQNKSLIHSNQMCQNIVLEMIIHLLQAQKFECLRSKGYLSIYLCSKILFKKLVYMSIYGLNPYIF